MHAPGAHPDKTRLREHLSDVLPAADQAALVSHLDTCLSCQETLQSLVLENGWLLQAAARVHQAAPTVSPSLRRVLDGLTHHGEANAAAVDSAAWRAFLTPADQPGQLGRIEHYAITSVLGSGGMGIVFKAVDETLQRVVAIKMPAPALAFDASARARFAREARAAAAIAHPNVVTVHAVAEVNGLPYLVSEFVPGESLHTRLARCGPLDVAQVIHIGKQVASGLAAAHALGVVHRDVTPGNILIKENSEVKITDFGLARVVDEARVSRSGVVAGTPDYMAPEQARGEAVGHRADLFSLGSVLYALCTGRAPFAADGALATLKRVCEETPAPIRDINPRVPEWLAAVIAKLQAKDPTERFRSAAEVAEALERRAHPSQDFRPRTAWSRRRVVAIVAAAACLLAMTTAVLPQIIIRIRNPDGTASESKLPKGATLELTENGKVVAAAAALVNTSGSLRLFDKHSGEVQSVAISPDGKRLLVGRRDATMHILDAATGTELRVFPVHGDIIWGVAFSPDGRQALSCSQNSVRRWDVETGRELRGFTGHTGAVSCATFCADGKRALSGSADKTVRLWDLESGQELHRFEGHTEAVRCVTASPDGMRLLSGIADCSMRLWNLDDGRELRCFPGHQTWVWCAAFAADGRTLLSGSGTHNRDIDGSPFDCRVRLWDAETGKLVRQFIGHDREVTSVAFCSKGRHVLSAGADGVARLWEANTGELVHRFIGHGKTISSMARAADERHFITGSFDRSVRVWELPTTTK